MKAARAALVALALAGAAVTGCAPKVTHGTVYSRTFDPAHIEEDEEAYVLTVTCFGGNPPFCTPIYGWRTVYVPHPDRWYLNLSDEKRRKGTVSVSPADFGRYAVGDLYP